MVLLCFLRNRFIWTNVVYIELLRLVFKKSWTYRKCHCYRYWHFLNLLLQRSLHGTGELRNPESGELRNPIPEYSGKVSILSSSLWDKYFELGERLIWMGRGCFWDLLVNNRNFFKNIGLASVLARISGNLPELAESVVSPSNWCNLRAW